MKNTPTFSDRLYQIKKVKGLIGYDGIQIGRQIVPQ